MRLYRHMHPHAGLLHACRGHLFFCASALLAKLAWTQPLCTLAGDTTAVLTPATTRLYRSASRRSSIFAMKICRTGHGTQQKSEKNGVSETDATWRNRESIAGMLQSDDV